MTTKTLGEASDIQWQGTRDLSSTNTSQGLTTGLIIGRFKRGRTDRPMLITRDSIKSRLGYDKANPDYLAVQDCLDTGVPNIWVLNVGVGSDSNSCTPSSLSITPTWIPSEGKGALLAYEFTSSGTEFVSEGVIRMPANQIDRDGENSWTPAQLLARALIFYSGIDLLRQTVGEAGMSFDVNFQNINGSEPIIPMTLNGISSSPEYPNVPLDTPNSQGLFNVSSTLTLKVNPGEMIAGFEDWVLNTFGHDVTIHSCARHWSTAM